MIRKMLVIAAAVAMPVTAIAAVTTSGVAGAAKPAPVAGVVPITGTVTFAAPGLSAGGAITNKTVESAVSLITPTAGGIAGLTPKSIKSKIPSATTPCWSTLPVYSKTAPVGGVLASGAPQTCDFGGGAASSDSPVVAADVKTAIKDQNYYDTSASFATSGTSSIVAALNAKPIKLSDNGNNSALTVTGANSVLPGGACGGNVGFQIDGTLTLVGIGHASVLVCLTTDTGSNVTGDFFTDILGTTATIATATVAGSSAVTFSA
jgi:hypothetical protein